MSFFNRIFKTNKVDCPRCLGKGHVDREDIRRLKKELFWRSGKCAYCYGIGQVAPDIIEKVSADFAYLTMDLFAWERDNIIKGDPEALARAADYEEGVANLVHDIEHWYYIENKEPGEVADQIFRQRGHYEYSSAEKQEFVGYIHKVLQSKLKK